MSILSIDLLTNDEYLFSANYSTSGLTSGNTSSYALIENYCNLYEVSGQTTQIQIISPNTNPFWGISTDNNQNRFYLFMPLK
jgi:hypothetical protein